MEINEVIKVDVSYTQYEAASIIEAIHDSLFRKVRWTISPAHEHWHALDFQIVKSSIDSLATAYTQTYMAFRQSIDDLDDGEDISPDFEEAFIVPNEVWSVIDQITISDTWDEVEIHYHGESLCQACKELSRTPKA